MDMLMKMKEHGMIRIELFPDLAPVAVKSLSRLVSKGKYDGRAIERLEPDFVIQPLFQDGKDPEIDQMIEPEFRTRQDNHSYPFGRGVVAMAGDENFASGGQFFICLKERDYLQGNFTVIGKVVSGWEEIERLEAVEVDAFLDKESGRIYHVPKEKQVVETIEIIDER